MSASRQLLQLQEVDLLLGEVATAAGRARLTRLGLPSGDLEPIQKQRLKIFASVDHRWQRLYERAHLRYGRGVVQVRDRICQGCRVQLPTSASPGPGEFLTLCESCGRILYWG